MPMRVQLYELNHGDCPYLDNRTWITHAFRAEDLPDGIYDHLVAGGWRRSGLSFYQNHCPGCRLCIPIRVRPHHFRPSRSQRRVIRRNADLSVERRRLEYSAEVLQLYAAYSSLRHDTRVSKQQYMGFLGRSAITTDLMLYRAENRLVGVGWVDVLADGLSSVYFAFEPAEGSRSLGTYSVIRELEEVERTGGSWLYLGFYVPGSVKMDYKARFRPHELLVNDEWVEGTDEIHEALRREARIGVDPPTQEKTVPSTSASSDRE